MKKRFTLLLALVCAFMLTGCWTAHMANLPPEIDPAPDSATDPWGISLSAEDVTLSGMTLVCTQSGGSPTGELQTGTPFWLEVSTDAGWESLPYADPENEIAWTMQALLIPKNERIEWSIGWAWIYGKLQPGTYRIGKTVTDFRGPGDYDNAIYYAEFTIPQA